MSLPNKNIIDTSCRTRTPTSFSRCFRERKQILVMRRIECLFMKFIIGHLLDVKCPVMQADSVSPHTRLCRSHKSHSNNINGHKYMWSHQAKLGPTTSSNKLCTTKVKTKTILHFCETFSLSACLLWGEGDCHAAMTETRQRTRQTRQTRQRTRQTRQRSTPWQGREGRVYRLPPAAEVVGVVTK